MYFKSKIHFIFLLAACLIAAGCSSGFLGLAPAGDRKEYTQARALYEQGNYEAAIAELQDYIYKTKNVKRREARAYRLLGISYEKTGQYGKALEVYLEALEFHPDNVPLLLEAARLYQQTHLTARSMALYEHVLELDPDNAEALAGQADNYAAIGFYSKARQFYDRFFTLDPSAAPQYRARYAHTFLNQRKYEQAFIHITMALSQDDQNADFWFLSARARRGLGQKDEALRDLKAALALAPERLDLLGQQALWLYEMGQYDAAQKTAQQMQALSPESQLSLLVQGLLAQREGKTKQAQQLWQQVVTLNPETFTAQVAARLLQQ